MDCPDSLTGFRHLKFGVDKRGFGGGQQGERRSLQREARRASTHVAVASLAARNLKSTGIDGHTEKARLSYSSVRCSYTAVGKTGLQIPHNTRTRLWELLLVHVGSSLLLMPHCTDALLRKMR